MTIDHYYDITDRIPVKLSNPQNQQTYYPTGVAYDISIGGQPFFLLNDDNNPYRNVTAQYRKQQIDQSREPGEQTLTGWWLRSQSSFHLGQGITFFEPAQDESLRFQYTYSKNCDVWTKGQVTLLPRVFTGHYTTDAFMSNGRPNQYSRSIDWDSKEGILLHDGYDVDKVDVDGNETHFINYNAGTDKKVLGICDDGVYAYWITVIDDAGVTKTAMYKKALSLDYTTPGTLMWKDSSVVATNVVLEYTKERIVGAINNGIYEWATTASALGTAVYTHPDTDVVFTSITSSGAAIYLSAFSGVQSNIYKFTLSTSTGAMPTLTSAITAAELPVGEKVFRIAYYLGSMAIGTSLGLRMAAVSDTDGSIAYGPLIFESEQAVYDVCFRDKFLWCATNVDGCPGLTRVNLGQPVSTLVYAYAWDLYDPTITGRNTTSCAFAGNTDQIMFTTAGITKGTSITYKQLTSNVATLTTSTAHGLAVNDVIWIEAVDSTFNGYYTITAVPSTTTFSYAKTAANVALTAVSPAGTANSPGAIYIQHATELAEEGILHTGYVRYNTLENKIFKYIVPRFDTTYGSLKISSIDANGLEFGLGSFSEGTVINQVGIGYPTGAQQYLGFEFTFNRYSLDATKGPKFTGYQLKVLPAVPRQYLIQYPCSLYDSESDKFGNKSGYEGAAVNRLEAIQQVESNGDTVKIEDFRTGQVYTGIIEETDFINRTPTDKRYSGFGGLLLVTIRTIS